MNKDIRVEFVRGNNERFISDTSRFKPTEEGSQYCSIIFDELPFICVSSFFMTKNGDWKEKTCEFKVTVQDEKAKGKFKLVALKKFDMSSLLNNQKELKGDLIPITLPLTDDEDFVIQFEMSINISEQTYTRKLSIAMPPGLPTKP